MKDPCAKCGAPRTEPDSDGYTHLGGIARADDTWWCHLCAALPDGLREVLLEIEPGELERNTCKRCHRYIRLERGDWRVSDHALDCSARTLSTDWGARPLPPYAPPVLGGPPVFGGMTAEQTVLADAKCGRFAELADAARELLIVAVTESGAGLDRAQWTTKRIVRVATAVARWNVALEKALRE